VQDLDGEVLALLTEHLAQLLLEDLACPVMRVDDVVAALELDVLDHGRLEVLEELLVCLGNGVLLGCLASPATRTTGCQVCR
jgi:uncharacterized protein YbaR (Trm112 family)